MGNYLITDETSQMDSNINFLKSEISRLKIATKRLIMRNIRRRQSVV